VDVSGKETLLVEEILEWADIEVGMSMFEIDEQLAARRLEEHPWIRNASVVKQMPDRVIVEVTERELSAMVYSDQLWHVDSDGTIFEKHQPSLPIDQVIITGIDDDLMTGDQELLRTELCKIIQILDEYERMGLSSIAPVTSVHREHGGGIVLYVGDDAREVRLGQGHTRKKLKRLREVLGELRKEKLDWDYIMVDSRNFPERVVVKLRTS
jgi:cell division septal protein FtsQ